MGNHTPEYLQGYADGARNCHEQQQQRNTQAQTQQQNYESYIQHKHPLSTLLNYNIHHRTTTILHCFVRQTPQDLVLNVVEKCSSVDALTLYYLNISSTDESRIRRMKACWLHITTSEKRDCKC
ncbi:MAG: hypothetical protein JO327_09240 [Nitrososphaeraceae archaeon]|nr:hypothetical protein [Nitrososphaeraceae archaeon]